MEKEKQKPVHEVKLPFNGGLIIGSLWRHEGEQGRPYFSVSFSRGHKDDKSDKWSYSQFFGRDELLGLVRVAEVCHGHIVTGVLSGGSNE